MRASALSPRTLGPALSPLRAWIAIGLVLAWYAVVLTWGVEFAIDMPSLFLAPVVLLALMARLPHAAALVAGVAAGTAVDYLLATVVHGSGALSQSHRIELAICLAGMVVLLPARPSRWFLAMFACGASCALSRGVCVYVTDPSTSDLLALVMPCALAVAAVAIALRMRGAWIPCAVVLAIFVFGTLTLVRLGFFYDASVTTYGPIDDASYLAYNLMTRLAAVGSAIAATALASRGTRHAPRSVADLRARFA